MGHAATRNRSASVLPVDRERCRLQRRDKIGRSASRHGVGRLWISPRISGAKFVAAQPAESRCPCLPTVARRRSATARSSFDRRLHGHSMSLTALKRSRSMNNSTG